MNKKLASLSLALAALLLTACDMYAPPSVTDRRVQVREDKVVQQVAVADMSDDYLASLAQKYTKAGTGPVSLTVTYDPDSHTNTAMHAGDEAVRVSRTLHKQGVREVDTNVLPVRGQGSDAVAILSYSSYQADAPANCGQMPGMAEATIDHDPDYKLGCTVESQFAKQIANPSDLLGNAAPPSYSDGRGASNIVDVYRTGATNKPLTGETASKKQ